MSSQPCPMCGIEMQHGYRTLTLTYKDQSSIFDMPGLLGRLMGDKKLATRVMDSFLADMPRQLLSLAKFVAAGSVPDVENQAHRIKGAAASVGAVAMEAVALEMEMAGIAGNLAGVTERMAALSAQFARFEEAVGRQSEAQATIGEQ